MNTLAKQEHESIEVDGRKVVVEYSRCGHKLGVVLSHGIYNDMHTSVVEKLFNRLSVDNDVLRFNFSFAGNTENRDVERSVKELDATIDFLGCEETVLIGKSFGGYISSLVAAQQKHGIPKVIALGYYLHEEGKPLKVFDLDDIKSMKPSFVIIKGSNDPYCDTDVLKNRLPNCKLYTIDNAEHSFKPISGSGSREVNEERVISIVMNELYGLS